VSLPDRPRARFHLVRHRLRQGDFARVYRSGRRAQGRHLAVVVLENGLEHTRLGLSVAKRHHRSAVARNHVRRVFREAFRLSLHELPSGVDVVMIATGPARVALHATREELLELVGRALRKPPRDRGRR
jgi:ribonuclease P protein component